MSKKLLTNFTKSVSRGVIPKPFEAVGVNKIGERGDDVFRKTFHVPRAWIENETLKPIFTQQLRSQTQETFEFVRSILESCGYLGDSHHMVHDYLYYMIMDLLDKEGSVFVTNNEIKGDVSISELFSQPTPDLVIQSTFHRKTTIIDVNNCSLDSVFIEKKKSKYESISFQFDFRVVTPTNLSESLVGILTLPSIAFLSYHFSLFHTEYSDWRARLNSRGIVCNENRILNREVDDVPFSPHPKAAFLVALSERARVLLAQDSI